MKLAVLSGKGGTGKTFVSVNLAASASKAVYLDCDVEEPNGHLFFKPENVIRRPVMKLLPQFDENKCTGCRKCTDFCKFNALAFIGKKPMVFPDICHSCGGCALLCPSEAVLEIRHEIGFTETGTHKNVTVSTGMLNIGESSGIPIINKLLHSAADDDSLTVIDCPPGSACPVVESVRDADYCILVAEPTQFGLHNFRMVYELVNLLHKPCGVVINKAPKETTVMDDFCKSENIHLLARIPYSLKSAQMGASAQIAVEEDPEAKRLFAELLQKVRMEVHQ